MSNPWPKGPLAIFPTGWNEVCELKSQMVKTAETPIWCARNSFLGTLEGVQFHHIEVLLYIAYCLPLTSHQKYSHMGIEPASPGLQGEWFIHNIVVG